MVGVEPLRRLDRAHHGRVGLGVLRVQRLDRARSATWRTAPASCGSAVDRALAGRETDALAAARAIGELELVVLGRRLLGEDAGVGQPQRLGPASGCRSCVSGSRRSQAGPLLIRRRRVERAIVAPRPAGSAGSTFLSSTAVRGRRASDAQRRGARGCVRPARAARPPWRAHRRRPSAGALLTKASLASLARVDASSLLGLGQLLLEASPVTLAVLGADREARLCAGADHDQRGSRRRLAAGAATVGRTRASRATTSAMASKASARSACSKRSSASSQVAGSMPASARALRICETSSRMSATAAAWSSSAADSRSSRRPARRR